MVRVQPNVNSKDMENVQLLFVFFFNSVFCFNSLKNFSEKERGKKTNKVVNSKDERVDAGFSSNLWATSSIKRIR